MFGTQNSHAMQENKLQTLCELALTRIVQVVRKLQIIWVFQIRGKPTISPKSRLKQT
jgi:hypothetical protein